MRVKIEIPKIHCSRTTNEINPDDVYYHLIVFAAKVKGKKLVGSSQNAIFGVVSEVKNKVKKGTAWRPQVNDHIIDVDDDVVCIGTHLCLKEEDNGVIYRQLQSNPLQHIDATKFDLGKVAEKIAGAFAKILKGDVGVIVSVVINIVKDVVKHLSQDDEIGSADDAFPISPDIEEGLPREYPFEGHGGKYHVGLKVSKVE